MVIDHVLNFKSLLQDRPFKNFLLDCDFHLNPPWMGLRPNEAGVNDSDLGKSSQFPET